MKSKFNGFKEDSRKDLTHTHSRSSRVLREFGIASSLRPHSDMDVSHKCVQSQSKPSSLSAANAAFRMRGESLKMNCLR